MAKYEKGSARDIFNRYGLTIPQIFEYIDKLSGATTEKTTIDYSCYRTANGDNFAYGDKIGNGHAGLMVILDKGFVSDYSPKQNLSGVILMPYDSEVVKLLNNQGYEIGYEGEVYNPETKAFEPSKQGGAQLRVPGSAGVRENGEFYSTFSVDNKDYDGFELAFRNSVQKFAREKELIIKDMQEYLQKQAEQDAQPQQ